MRVLLDENLPRKLVGRLGGDVDATTIAKAGWRGKKNGELLRLAEKEFDAFVTTDKGFPHQQNVPGLELAVVVLRARSNALEDLEPLIDGLRAAPPPVRASPSFRRSAPLPRGCARPAS